MENTNKKMTVYDAAVIIKAGPTKENIEALKSLSKSFAPLVNILTPLVHDDRFMAFLQTLPEKLGPRTLNNNMLDAIDYVNPKRFVEDEDGNLVERVKKDKKNKKKSKKAAEEEPAEDEVPFEEEAEDEDEEEEEKPAKKSKKAKKAKKSKKAKKEAEAEDDEDDDFDFD